MEMVLQQRHKRTGFIFTQSSVHSLIVWMAFTTCPPLSSLRPPPPYTPTPQIPTNYPQLSTLQGCRRRTSGKQPILMQASDNGPSRTHTCWQTIKGQLQTLSLDNHCGRVQPRAGRVLLSADPLAMCSQQLGQAQVQRQKYFVWFPVLPQRAGRWQRRWIPKDSHCN